MNDDLDTLNYLIGRAKERPFKSRENSMVLTKLEEAHMWLERAIKTRPTVTVSISEVSAESAEKKERMSS